MSKITVTHANPIKDDLPFPKLMTDNGYVWYVLAPGRAIFIGDGKYPPLPTAISAGLKMDGLVNFRGTVTITQE